MRSWQISTWVSKPEEKKYSDLQVLRSAAGFYLGTIYNGDELQEPGSRDTNYFVHKELADKALALLEESNNTHGYMGPEFIVGDWMEKCKNRLGIDVYYRWEP